MNMNWKDWNYTLSGGQKGLLIGFILGTILLSLFWACNYNNGFYKENSFCSNYLIGNIIMFLLLIISLPAIILMASFYYLIGLLNDSIMKDLMKNLDKPYWGEIFLIMTVLICFSWFGFFIGSRLDRQKIKKSLEK